MTPSIILFCFLTLFSLHAPAGDCPELAAQLESARAENRQLKEQNSYLEERVKYLESQRDDVVEGKEAVETYSSYVAAQEEKWHARDQEAASRRPCTETQP